MISYFQYGKGHLDVCEDSLTASLFDLLKYLPVDLFWDILKQSLLVGGSLPSDSGEIVALDYWPKWSAVNKAITNTNYVEPDVFIRFTHFDLIIEAKRYDANQQYDAQLYNEVIAYYSEYEEDEKPLYMLLVGGLKDNDSMAEIVYENNTVLVSKTNWTRLLDTIIKTSEQLSNEDKLPAHFNFVFQDIIAALGKHGFHHKLWLDTLPDYTIQNQLEDFKLLIL
jgi:hypothetical protein